MYGVHIDMLMTHHMTRSRSMEEGMQEAAYSTDIEHTERERWTGRTHREDRQASGGRTERRRGVKDEGEGREQGGVKGDERRDE